MPKLGDVVFSIVENETVEYSNEITDRPTEEQVTVDNIRNQPSMLNITGLVVGDDADEKINKLEDYSKSGSLLTYVGKSVSKNMAIELFRSDHSPGCSNGYIFSITLKHIKISKSQLVRITLPDPVTSKTTTSQTKKVTNKGTQQPKISATQTDFRNTLAAQGLFQEVYG